MKVLSLTAIWLLLSAPGADPRIPEQAPAGTVPPPAAPPALPDADAPPPPVMPEERQATLSNAHRPRIEASLKKVRAAQSDAEKQAARTELRGILADVFQEDMQARDKQAAEIETRLQALRRQYEARQEVKDKIIDLQLEVLLSDAAGLGFPGGPLAGSPGESFPPRGSSSQPTPWAVPLLPNSYSLENLKKRQPQVVDELIAMGHFAESPDGKYYVLASTNHPHGPTYLQLHEVSSGSMVSTALVGEVVGKLQFNEDGVVTRRKDGALRLLMPHPRPAAGARPVYPAAAVPVTAPLPMDPRGLVSEFTELVREYWEAKRAFESIEADMNHRLAEERKNQPNYSLEDLQRDDEAGGRAHWGEMFHERRRGWERMQQLYRTKLQLLELELRGATAAREAAQEKLRRLRQLYESGRTSGTEVAQQQAAAEAADLEVQRATALYELFKSIAEPGSQTENPPARAAPASGGTDDSAPAVPGAPSAPAPDAPQR